MNKEEKRYLVKERVKEDVKEHGTIKKAINFLRQELEEMESLWSKYSSDCLGHGISCTRLKIFYLERKLNLK